MKSSLRRGSNTHFTNGLCSCLLDSKGLVRIKIAGAVTESGENYAYELPAPQLSTAHLKDLPRIHFCYKMEKMFYFEFHLKHLYVNILAAP